MLALFVKGGCKRKSPDKYNHRLCESVKCLSPPPLPSYPPHAPSLHLAVTPLLSLPGMKDKYCPSPGTKHSQSPFSAGAFYSPQNSAKHFHGHHFLWVLLDHLTRCLLLVPGTRTASCPKIHLKAQETRRTVLERRLVIILEES